LSANNFTDYNSLLTRFSGLSTIYRKTMDYRVATQRAAQEVGFSSPTAASRVKMVKERNPDMFGRLCRNEVRISHAYDHSPDPSRTRGQQMSLPSPASPASTPPVPEGVADTKGARKFFFLPYNDVSEDIFSSRAEAMEFISDPEVFSDYADGEQLFLATLDGEVAQSISLQDLE
jgi:hypothetical protein